MRNPQSFITFIAADTAIGWVKAALSYNPLRNAHEHRLKVFGFFGKP